jgi:hypothetical protein
MGAVIVLMVSIACFVLGMIPFLVIQSYIIDIFHPEAKVYMEMMK